MLKKLIINNANIVNEGAIFKGSVLVENGIISGVCTDSYPDIPDAVVIDAANKYLIPGVIDDQVHFRDPGLTHKADIYTESRAAVAGGVTSFMDMPNTVPNTLTQELLEEKYKLASTKSLANYSFYMGVSNTNIDEVLKTDPSKVCGIKIFLGASTGNMLVDKRETLEEIFSKSKCLIAVHCEDEAVISENLAFFKEKYGDNIPVEYHADIRNSQACYNSSSFAINLAKKYGTRLHVLHLSSAIEMDLLSDEPSDENKKITSEACVHHLWFTDADYKTKGSLIKWNPAIKSAADRDAILKAINDNRIDVIATDHAPHTMEEKSKPYTSCPSGGPLVQHSLVAMFALAEQGKVPIETIVEKMCHAPARIFRIKNRGYIREGYHADLVIIDPAASWTVSKDNIQYKCGWSPFEGQTFNAQVTHTFVGGHLVYENGNFNETQKGSRLEFHRDR